MSRHDKQHLEEFFKKNGIDVKDGIIHLMIDKLVGAETEINAINDRHNKYVDRARKGEHRQYDTIGELRVRVDKLEQMIKDMKRTTTKTPPLSYDSPYQVSDLYMPPKSSYT